MALFDLRNIFRNKTAPTTIVQTAITTTARELGNEHSNSNTFSLSDAGLIATLYTCIKLKADIISTLPFKVYKTNEKGHREEFKSDLRYKLLHDEPNNYQTAQALRSAMLWDTYWTGNGFARINRNNGRIESYEWIDATKVKACSKFNNQVYYLIDDEEIVDGNIVKYHDIVDGRNVYHFRNSTNNGLWGQSPLDALFLTLSTTYKGIKTLDNFYKNNLFLQKALKTNFQDVRMEDAILKSEKEFDNTYFGYSPNRKVIRLPYNTDLVDVASTIQDAQVIDTVKFNANQIATAFGVPTILIGDSQGAKFGNVELLLKFFEATSLRVETDIIRRETEYKFFTGKERDSGMSAEFNFGQFAQSDNAGRAANYRTYFSMGVLSPNQIAGEEGYPTYEGGDIHIINGGGQTVEQMATKTEASTDTPSQDNDISSLRDEIDSLKKEINDLKSISDI